MEEKMQAIPEGEREQGELAPDELEQVSGGLPKLPSSKRRPKSKSSSYCCHVCQKTGKMTYNSSGANYCQFCYALLAPEDFQV